jgi:hypothetical protein
MVLIFFTVNVEAASLWTKYVAPNKSYSFHYPKGWKAITNDSIIGAENVKTDEQIMMAMIPFDPSMSAMDLSKEFLTLLKDGNPNIKASNWLSLSETNDDQILFDLTDKIDGKEYSGLGMVVKSDQQAMWFSYFAPESDYYMVRANYILQGFMESITSGSASQAPKIDYSIDVAGKIDTNARAFMFVLEFTLGAPFTQSQEKIILEELKDGWRYRSEDELKVNDQYPDLVKVILTLKQKDLEKLRAELEKTTKEWLDETEQSDPAVKIISSYLEKQGKVVIAGEPPLTEMSLTAYSEIIAYSRLLQKDSEAMPNQISQKTVNKIKKQVKKVWESFSADEKKDIATAPGLWVCLRTQLEYGTDKEQDKIRENLKKLEAVTRDIVANTGTDTNSGSTGGSGSGTDTPVDMTTHWCMMQIQQQTFNTYMWSRGFNYLPATGKMW